MAKNSTPVIPPATVTRLIKAMAGDIVQIQWHLADGTVWCEEYQVPPPSVVHARRDQGRTFASEDHDAPL